MRGPNPALAQIVPTLRLRVNGVVEQSDEEEEDEQADAGRYRPQARMAQPARKTASSLTHAARKIEHQYMNTSSDSDDTSSGAGDSASSSESSGRAPALANESDNDIEMINSPVDPADAPEIILLDAPPRYMSHFHPRPQLTPATTPPSALVTAVEMLSSTTIRMRATHRLPFLVRELRRGFHGRCSELLVPVFKDKRVPKLEVVYSGVGDEEYVARVEGSWLCPLCDLLGPLRTREILDCHLRWDHAEVFYEWQPGHGVDASVDDWELHLLIPENPGVDHGISDLTTVTGAHTSPLPDRPHTPDREASTSETLDTKRSSTSHMTPHTQRLASPFPSVSLSPPTPRAPKDEVKPDVSTIYTPTPSVSVTRETSSTGTSGTGGSTQPSVLTSSLAVTSRTTASSSVARPRAITPPLPADPLGPAARAPFLPAESEYGGPTVLYSCRPQGAGLFDLLGTLPAGAWGLLEWDLRDREQEVLESDMVGEELKVMQAVWMRWVGVNRNLLVTDYCKGVIAFVDEYWRIIHRGAGWSALRFFLVTLMANQFLTGREVARVLRHYEGLTGMDEWYD
ncbi:hypothetical protein HYPSUDRAFT_1032560 [Hypholoma sublateritium FD-334 SS-4]|uniref:Uncharacterized protein n=1 Tax=Hypholoma sublateritium (strain FD-334 SS-4) TaxID=945553 RepID=A0A0D2P7A0_HYPSF|nr:hypothetical protein HYPSUDRAFT_1032560 [Hypholoma sublateritium FD-334 SS-4]